MTMKKRKEIWRIVNTTARMSVNVARHGETDMKDEEEGR
jgi:hypothetical protein